MFSGMLKRFFKNIPYLEAFRAFLEQWKLWAFITGAPAVIGAAIMSAWAWWSNTVPGWASGLLGLAALALILVIVNLGYSLVLKRKQDKMLEKIVHIDRNALAEQIEEISKKIAEIIGDARTSIAEARWIGPADIRTIQQAHDAEARAQGKLVEKYMSLCATQVWMLIRRASKVTPIGRSDMFRIEHDVQSEHDLVEIHRFLAKISDDLRVPRPPIQP